MSDRRLRLLAIMLGMAWGSFATASSTPPKTPAPSRPVDSKPLVNFTHPDRVQGSFMLRFTREAQQMSGEEARKVANELAARHHGSVITVFTRRSGKGGPAIGFAVSMSESDVKRLAEDPRIESVQANVMMKITGSESLPSDKSRWHLDRLDQEALPLDNAYHFDPTALGESIDVYVIDTGVRTVHQEFDHIYPRVLHCSAACDHPDDPDHYPPVWLDVPDETLHQDCNGHGTAVASLIAGNTRGVARDANIIAIQAANLSGSDCNGGVDAIAALGGVNWVNWTMSGSQSVINLSLGYLMEPAYQEYTDVFVDLIEESMNQGASVVVAAGNENDDACDYMPAKMGGDTTVITVGASTKTDARRSDSNYGPCVTVFAPGDAQSAADRTSNSAYASWSQTSMAAPIVSGLVAIYKDLHPSASPYTVKQAISDDATLNALANVGSGSPNQLANTWKMSGIDYSHSGGGSGQDGGNEIPTGTLKKAAGCWGSVMPIVVL